MIYPHNVFTNLIMSSKTWGWVLLAVGIVGAFYAYSSSSGTLWTMIAIIVALVGAWMAFFRNEDQQQPPM